MKDLGYDEKGNLVTDIEEDPVNEGNQIVETEMTEIKNVKNRNNTSEDSSLNFLDKEIEI